MQGSDERLYFPKVVLCCVKGCVGYRRNLGENNTVLIPIGRTHVTIVQHGQCTLVGQNSYEPMTYFIIIDRSLMFFDDA